MTGRDRLCITFQIKVYTLGREGHRPLQRAPLQVMPTLCGMPSSCILQCHPHSGELLLALSHRWADRCKEKGLGRTPTADPPGVRVSLGVVSLALEMSTWA
jgi:hypothetical protein